MAEVLGKMAGGDTKASIGDRKMGMCIVTWVLKWATDYQNACRHLYRKMQLGTFGLGWHYERADVTKSP